MTLQRNPSFTALEICSRQVVRRIDDEVDKHLSREVLDLHDEMLRGFRPDLMMTLFISMSDREQNTCSFPSDG